MPNDKVSARQQCVYEGPFSTANQRQEHNVEKIHPVGYNCR